MAAGLFISHSRIEFKPVQAAWDDYYEQGQLIITFFPNGFVSRDKSSERYEQFASVVSRKELDNLLAKIFSDIRSQKNVRDCQFYRLRSLNKVDSLIFLPILESGNIFQFNIYIEDRDDVQNVVCDVKTLENLKTLVYDSKNQSRLISMNV